MEVKDHARYCRSDSDKRIDAILRSGQFAAKGEIPDRNKLTYENGYYVKIVSVFVDIVSSSKLTNLAEKPELARIYRCFISECTAIMKSHESCKEISIHGDCVWGAFQIDNEADRLDYICDIAIEILIMIDRLNGKLLQKNYPDISVGIGIDYGPSLMIKAGKQGSGIQDVVWMGNVVNHASKLSGKAGRGGIAPLLISKNFRSKLSYEYRNFFKEIVHRGKYIGCEANSKSFEDKVISRRYPRGLLDFLDNYDF